MKRLRLSSSFPWRSALVLWLTALNTFAALRPNILFIMSDDHAAHALSCYGSVINRTPQLDRIATGGLRFQNCFAVNSICTPSRATILTGKYSHRNGVTVFNRFNGEQPHVGKYLQQAGYQTAIIGKWHLFSDPTGFDYWCVLPGQGKYHDPEMSELGTNKVFKGYATDIITDLTIRWLEQRDTNRPFLLFSHHKAPHRNWEPDDKHAALFESQDIPTPATFDDEYATRSSAALEATMRIDRDLKTNDVKGAPPKELSGAALKQWYYQRYIKDYLRCIASVDDNVGRLLDYLDRTGLSTNTVVIYTSDQGFFLGDHNWYDKRFMYEESIRMPLLVRWPGVIPRGAVNRDMVLNVDFAPTFLQLAEMPVAGDMQGRSLVPLLRGQRPNDWRRAMYYRYYHYPADHRVQPHYGVRTERHKLIYFNKLDQWELFDLQSDPRETNNVYAFSAYANTVEMLKGELTRLRKELDDRDQFADRPPSGIALRKTTAQLVLRYDFAKMDGDRVEDVSGEQHHGRLAGGAVTAGHAGRAVEFKTAGAITLKSPPRTLNPAQKPLAVGAWCKPQSSNGVVVALGGPAQGFSLFLSNSIPCFALRGDSELSLVQSARSVKLGEWMHLAGSLNAESELQVRVNGQLAGILTNAVPIVSKPHDGLSVGADTGNRVVELGPEFSWIGLLEDVRIFWGDPSAETWREWSGSGVNAGGVSPP